MLPIINGSDYNTTQLLLLTWKCYSNFWQKVFLSLSNYLVVYVLKGVTPFCKKYKFIKIYSILPILRKCQMIYSIKLGISMYSFCVLFYLISSWKNAILVKTRPKTNCVDSLLFNVVIFYAEVFALCLKVAERIR